MLKRLSEKDWVFLIRKNRTDITSCKEQRSEISDNITDLKERYTILSKKAQDETGGDFIDPATLARKRRSLVVKESSIEEIENIITSNAEMLQTRNLELSRLEDLRDNFPLESYTRRLELLDGLRKNLQKMQSNLKQERTLMANQKKSVTVNANSNTA